MKELNSIIQSSMMMTTIPRIESSEDTSNEITYHHAKFTPIPNKADVAVAQILKTLKTKYFNFFHMPSPDDDEALDFFKDEWRKAITGLKPRAVTWALDNIGRDPAYHKYPPTPDQFRAFCAKYKAPNDPQAQSEERLQKSIHHLYGLLLFARNVIFTDNEHPSFETFEKHAELVLKGAWVDLPLLGRNRAIAEMIARGMAMTPKEEVLIFGGCRE